MFKRHTLVLVAFLLAPLATNSQETSTTTFPKPDEHASPPSERKPHIGVILGTMDPDNNYSTAFEYGLDAGYQPWVPFGLGIELSQVITDRAQGNRTQSLTRYSILPRLTYNLGGSVPVVRHGYLGLGMGAIIDDGSPNQGAHLGLAPLLGFDIPLVENPTSDFMSLGLGAKYVFVSGPSPDAFSINGLVKYWF